jgi:tape measure domain-containing protein
MSVKGGDVIFNFKSDDKELQKSVNDMGSSIKKMVTALGLDKLISKTISALNNSLDGAIKRVDTLNNFPKVMSNLGIATEDASKIIKELSDDLTGLPTTLDEGALAVQRFTSANNDIRKSKDYFIALNNAILAGGANATLQASALEQLSQAYSKGRLDMMEWRTLQMAMPAQLNQVAKAIGLTTEQMGAGLRKAVKDDAYVREVAVDEFMDAMVRLNTTGIEGFASFEEQAKSSTGGIATSITNVKTAITRGLANSIEALNKALKNANLPTVNDMIQKFGTTISKAFNKVNEGIGKIKFEKLIPVVKEVVQYMKNLKNTMLGFVKEVFKKIDWNMVLKIAPTILNIVGTIKILNPLIKTGTSLISGLGGVIKALSSPIGLATAVITGLATAFIYLANSETEEQRQMREFREEVINSKKELDEFNASVDKNLQKSLAEIDHTKALNDELKTLVDENGNVKEGYEERVKFILNQLNEALGLELKLVDGQIQGYKDEGKAIDTLIQKKRAEAILNAESEKYQKSIEKKSEAYEKMREIAEKTGMTFDEIRKKIENYQNTIHSDEELLFGEDTQWMEDFGNNFKELDEIVKTSLDNMKQYENDYALFTEEKYNEIGTTITTNTQNWTDETADQMRKDLEEKEKKLHSGLEMFKETGEKIYENETNQGIKDLALLRSQLEGRTKEITKMSPEEIEAWIRLAQNDRQAFNNIIGQTSGDTRNQLQAIADVIDSNGYLPETEMQQVAQSIAMKVRGLDSWSWGLDLGKNLANGLNSARSFVSGASNGLAQAIKATIGHSVPKTGPLKDELTYMPDMVNNLIKTLEASTPNFYKALSKMAGKMKDQLSLGFGMSPTLNNVSSYNPSVNVTIHNNMETDFMGNLVSNIKTFSNGSKNDYNYGMGG